MACPQHVAMVSLRQHQPPSCSPLEWPLVAVMNNCSWIQQMGDGRKGNRQKPQIAQSIASEQVNN